jgi:hypothetical protein
LLPSHKWQLKPGQALESLKAFETMFKWLEKENDILRPGHVDSRILVGIDEIRDLKGEIIGA